MAGMLLRMAYNRPANSASQDGNNPTNDKNSPNGNFILKMITSIFMKRWELKFCGKI